MGRCKVVPSGNSVVFSAVDVPSPSLGEVVMVSSWVCVVGKACSWSSESFLRAAPELTHCLEHLCKGGERVGRRE